MKISGGFAGLLLILLLLTGCTFGNNSNIDGGEDITDERSQIELLLDVYEQALNASNVEAVLKLYADDGVFMPASAPTAEGLQQVEVAYRNVFDMIRLNIKFDIDDIIVHEDVAFARSVSRGEVTILATDTTQPEENRELFVFKNVSGDWKIASYMFNKMSPQN